MKLTSGIFSTTNYNKFMQAYESNIRSSSIRADAIFAALTSGYGLWKGNYYFLGAGLNYLMRSITLTLCEDRHDLESSMELSLASSTALLTCAGLSTAEDTSIATAAGYLGTALTFFNAYCMKTEVEASLERVSPERSRQHTP